MLILTLKMSITVIMNRMYPTNNSKLQELNVYYQNCRGLRTKQAEFVNNLIGSDYDVVCLTETWLSDDFYSSNYFTNDYYVYRKDRLYTPDVTRGGGVLIAVKKLLKVVRLFDLDFNDRI